MVVGPAWIIQNGVSEEEIPNQLLFCERAMALTNGVTPLIPLLFLGLMVGAWGYCDWQRLRLMERLCENYGSDPPRPESTGYPNTDEILERVMDGRDQLRKFLICPRTCFMQIPIKATFLVMLTAVVDILGWLQAKPSIEQWLYQLGYRAAFYLAGWLILLRLIELLALWKLLNALLKEVAGLPLAGAIDRLPRSAVGVFARLTDVIHKQSERAPMVARQIEALDRAFPDADPEQGRWAAALGLVEPEQVRKLKKSLSDAAGTASNPRDWLKQANGLIRHLVPFWSRRSIAAAYADPSGSLSAAPRRRDDADWQLLDERISRASQAPGDLGAGKMSRRALAEFKSRVRDWLVTAKDFLSLAMVTQLSLYFCYFWAVVEYLVIASLILLVSITCYPFVPQGFLLSAIGLMIAVIAIVITFVLVKFNRDELISRIVKTTPNQLSLDRHFVLSIMQYTLPLVITLGALSFTLSDLIRSWFEPFFR
jgi:hypothetical protein